MHLFLLLITKVIGYTKESSKIENLLLKKLRKQQQNNVFKIPT